MVASDLCLTTPVFPFSCVVCGGLAGGIRDDLRNESLAIGRSVGSGDPGCFGAAEADMFIMPGTYSFPITTSGEYSIDVLGASGGESLLAVPGGVPGGRGAEVFGDVKLVSGDVLTLIVGGHGGTGPVAGGGGGGSFITLDNNGGYLLAAAGGGGGAGYAQVGLPGLGTNHGGAGAGIGGGAGGMGVNVATAGAGGSSDLGFNGGGGGGYAAKGGEARGGDGSGGFSGGGGNIPNFPNAGSGSGSPSAGGPIGSGGNGGPGGGGGGGGGAAGSRSGGGGGGGGGFSGGGGGSGKKATPGAGYGGYAGGGGGSYLSGIVTDPVLISGVNVGDGGITISFLNGAAPPVPEPSTWAMMATGFAGLGWLARIRKRKTPPA